MNITHVSTTLRELKEKQLVICLTPNLNKGKIYGLTTLGKELQESLENLNSDKKEN